MGNIKPPVKNPSLSGAATAGSNWLGAKACSGPTGNRAPAAIQFSLPQSDF